MATPEAREASAPADLARPRIEYADTHYKPFDRARPGSATMFETAPPLLDLERTHTHIQFVNARDKPFDRIPAHEYTRSPGASTAASAPQPAGSASGGPAQE